MALFLQALALALAVVGVGTFAYGTDGALLSLGNTLMIVGAVVAMGGVLLFGLGAIVKKLGALTAGLQAMRSTLENAAGPARVHPTLVETPAPPVAPAAFQDLPPEPDLFAEARPAAAPVPQPEPAPAPQAAEPPPIPVAPAEPRSFRERFGLRPAAVAAGAAAGAGALFATRRGEAAEPEPAAAADAAEPIPETPFEQGLAEPSAARPAEPDDLGPAFEELLKGEEPRPAAVEPEPDLEREPVLEPEPVSEPEIEPRPSPREPSLLERLRLSVVELEVERPAPVAERGPIIEARSEEVEEPEAAAPVAEPLETEPEPEAAGQPEEATPSAEAEPAFSIEDELQRALSSALLEGDVRSPAASREPEPEEAAAEEAEAETYAEAPGEAAVPAPAEAAEPAPEIHIEPVVVPAPEPPAPPRPAAAEAPPRARPEDSLAALARDFPELGDLLAPRKSEPAPAAEPPAPPRPPAPLLRQGVIAGISFRLFGDGTIEADLPEGPTRFASLKDFRAHVGG